MSQNGKLPNNNNNQDKADLVAYWSVPLADGVHTVEFEHGTTTGKRVLRVDGQVNIEIKIILPLNHTD